MQLQIKKLKQKRRALISKIKRIDRRVGELQYESKEQKDVKMDKQKDVKMDKQKDVKMDKQKDGKINSHKNNYNNKINILKAGGDIPLGHIIPFVNFIYHKSMLKNYTFTLNIDCVVGGCGEWVYTDKESMCKCGSSIYMYDHANINYSRDITLATCIPLYRVIKVSKGFLTDINK
jgi:hypothetical protein